MVGRVRVGVAARLADTPTKKSCKRAEHILLDLFMRIIKEPIILALSYPTNKWRYTIMAVWNNQTVQNVGGRARSTLNDFQKFILRGNVVDLAVGIMIGAAFSGVVNALVGDIITPLIRASKNGLSALAYKVPYTGGTLQVGAFLHALLAFLLLALVTYLFVVTIPLRVTRCAYWTSKLPPADQVPPSAAQRT